MGLLTSFAHRPDHNAVPTLLTRGFEAMAHSPQHIEEGVRQASMADAQTLPWPQFHEGIQYPLQGFRRFQIADV